MLGMLGLLASGLRRSLALACLGDESLPAGQLRRMPSTINQEKSDYVMFMPMLMLMLMPMPILAHAW
jgi:hypothetical protein